MSIIDKIYVSAEMNKVKPDAGFYNYILNDLNIKASDSMYHLYDELNKDFGKDVMYKTYTEKAGIANLLAELIDGGYSTIDTINFIQYVNSNVYNEQGKNTFWYQGIEKYTDDYNINSEYIPDKNNDYDCHPKQYQKQITHN